MVDALARVGTLAGIILVALVVIGFILTRLYRRSTKDMSLIRTGFGGEKVVLSGGIMVIPVLHELMSVKMTTVKLEVDRTKNNALITLDKLRVDVIGLFHIKVKPDAVGVASAAQTLGQSVNDKDAVKALFEGKLVSALRSVAATMSMEHLHSDRRDFISKVQAAVQADLDINGFQLESVSVTHFDQTSFQHLDENNIFDAEGLTVAARQIEERKRERNEITVTNRVAMEERNLEGNRQSLRIAQESEEARLLQEQTLSARRAEQATAIAAAEAEQTLVAQTARIEATRKETIAQTEADAATKEVQIKRDAMIQTATIQRDRTVELERIETQVATQEASERESAAAAKANEARAAAVRAEESVATAKATEVANRAKQVAVIQAQQDAEQKAVGITINAQAESDAAALRATAITVEATARAEAKTIEAEADDKVNTVRANGERAMNEAANLLSETQTNLIARKSLLEILPTILTAASKPMEQIDKISIIEARGLHGEGGAGDATGGNNNLADAAVSAAMKYRVASPLVDGLLGEIGLNGGSMNGLLSGIAASISPAPAVAEVAAPAAPAPAAPPTVAPRSLARGRVDAPKPSDD